MKEAITTTEEHRRTSWNRRLVLIAAGLATLVVIALAVGLGVGLTQRGGGENESTPSTSASPSSSPPPSNRTIWQPAVNSSWQIVLQNAIDLKPSATSVDPDVDIFDIDLFENDRSTIDTLHSLSKRVICYFSAGSYEPYRSDASQFGKSDMGHSMDGWPDEKWVDIRSQSVRRIMAGRISLARGKGCDAVDPDNVDGYNNENGLGLSTDDSIDFMRFLSAQASSNGLAIGLKNAAEIVPEAKGLVQFAVNEQCTEYRECASFGPFIQTNKPVFHIEYPKRNNAGRVSPKQVEQVCSNDGLAAGSEGFSTIIKDFDLDGWAQYCDGTGARTALQER